MLKQEPNSESVETPMDTSTIEFSKVNSETTSLSQQSQPIKNTLRSHGKMEKCDTCSKYITNQDFSEHVKSCKLYHKFIGERPKGYKCKICSFKTIGKSKSSLKSTYLHIKENHQDSLENSNCLQSTIEETSNKENSLGKDTAPA